MASVTVIYLIFGLIGLLTNGAKAITEFHAKEEINAEFNKSLMHNLTIHDNIYVGAHMKFTKNAFRKPAETESVFHIGTQSNEFYPAAFLNIAQRRLFFKFSEHDRFDFMDLPKIENITIGKSYHSAMWISQSSMQIDVNGKTIYNQEINAHSTNINMSLYFGNPWNNAANVNISNFTFISSNDKISYAVISRVQKTSKYHYTSDEEQENKEPAALGTSFADIMAWDQLDVQRWLNQTDTVLLRKFNAIYPFTDIHQDITGKNLLLMYEYKDYFNDFTKLFSISSRSRLQKNLELLIKTMTNKTVIDYTKHNDHTGFKEGWVTEQNKMIDVINAKQHVYLTLTVKIDPDEDDSNYDDGDWGSEDEDDSNYPSDQYYGEDYEEGPIEFNILHVGGSSNIKYPSINFNSKDNTLSFELYRISDQPKFDIERDTKYKIEIYISMNRCQIAIDKEIIFDTSLYPENYYIYNNVPVFLSSPWMDSSDKVKVSKFGMITSDVNITRGDKLKEYPFKYCLRTHTYHDDNDAFADFDGKWTPYGYYNNHTLFYKSYISGIKESEWIYLFYYQQSWRIYLYPYNTSDALNADKYFAFCDINDFNVAKCSNNFKFIKTGLYSNRNFKLRAGPCKPKPKKWVSDDVEYPSGSDYGDDYYWGTTTKTPRYYNDIEPEDDVNVDEGFMQKLEHEVIEDVKSWFFWATMGFMAIICGFCVFRCKKIKNPIANGNFNSAKRIPFAEENVYKTATFRGEDGLSMDYQEMRSDNEKESASGHGDIRELKTEDIAVNEDPEENESEDGEDMIDTVPTVETDDFE